MSEAAILCLCGCQQPRRGDSRFAVGCYRRLGNEARRLLKNAQSEEKFQEGSRGMTYGCKTHPNWQTADRAERNRHFRSEHPPSPAKTRPKRPRMFVSEPSTS